jgi:hypothetical protein
MITIFQAGRERGICLRAFDRLLHAGKLMFIGGHWVYCSRSTSEV